MATTKRLRQITTVNLPANSESFTATNYFQSRDGLHVWDNFKYLILPATKPIEKTPAMEVAYSELLERSIDSQIRNELSESHVFKDATIFCSHLAGMIDSQFSGKEGPLLTSGYANIFYVQVEVKVLAVDAYWNHDDRRWLVYTYEVDDYDWGVGDRVFSATAVI